MVPVAAPVPWPRGSVVTAPAGMGGPSSVAIAAREFGSGVWVVLVKAEAPQVVSADPDGLALGRHSHHPGIATHRGPGILSAPVAVGSSVLQHSVYCPWAVVT